MISISIKHPKMLRRAKYKYLRDRGVPSKNAKIMKDWGDDFFPGLFERGDGA